MRTRTVLAVVTAVLLVVATAPPLAVENGVGTARAAAPTATAPVGAPDSYTMVADTELTIDAPGLTANDIDPDGDAVVLSNFAPPDNGDLTSIVTSGAFTYVPDPGFTGTDSFTYVLRDETGLFSDPVTVTIEVVPSPNRAPIGADDAYEVSTDSTLTVDAPGLTANDVDIDDDSFVLSNFAPPDNGDLTSIVTSGAFTYVPDPGFTGTDSFTYVLRDEHDAFSEPTTVTIEVVPSYNRGPIGTHDAYVLLADTTLTVGAPGLTANDIDPDEDSFVLSNFAPPDHGDLTSIVTSGAFTYVPDPGFTGTDSFTYVLRDEHGAFSEPTTVSLAVIDGGTAPVGAPDSYTVEADTELSVDAPGLTANDIDPDGDTFVLSNFAPPDHGDLTSIVTSGAFTYVPDPGFTGTDSFTYVLRDADGEFSDSVTVTIEVVESFNRAPSGSPDAYVVATDRELTVDAPGLTANDVDPDEDSFVLSNFAPPDHGDLTSIVTSGAFTYVPDPGFTGTDSFTYVLRDEHGAFSEPTTVTIEVVAASNRAPVGTADAYAMVGDTTLTVGAPGLIANDLDFDDDSFVLSNFAPPDHGDLTSIVTSGAFTYDPDPGFTGTDSFTYVLRDEHGAFSEPVTVTIEVVALNTPPTVDATAAPIGEGEAATLSVAITDPDADDTHSLTIDWGDGTTDTLATVPLSLAETHPYGDDGVYTVTVTVTDGDGVTDTTTVDVSVANLDPTVAVGAGDDAIDADGVVVGTAGTDVTVTATATDPGSDDLTFDWSTGDQATSFNDGVGPDPPLSPHGTYPFAATDETTVAVGTVGVDSVGVTVTDDDGGTATATATTVAVGDADATEGRGFWAHQYADRGKPHYDDAALTAFLDVTGALSDVFSESVPASTTAEADAVLSPDPASKQGDSGDPAADMREKATAQLLAAWLNLAAGGVAWDDPIDTGVDGVGVAPFHEVVAAAETILLDADATHEDLERAKDLAEAINQAVGP